ncbi:MAG: AI-2E family transporter [Patescibacteria group bacterium]
MSERKPELYFLLASLLGTFILAFLIFQPFLYALVLAMVFATVFHPVYKKIVTITHGWQNLSAFATVLIVVVLIFTPIIFLGMQIFQEAEQLYIVLANDHKRDVVLDAVSALQNNLQKYFPFVQEFSFNIDQYLRQWLSWLLGNLGLVFESFTNIVISSLLFLVALYYLLKDGQKLKMALVYLSPLSDADDEAISRKLGVAVNSVMKGSLLIALIQGVLTSIGFAIFGIQNVVLWGSVAAIAALIPGVGTSLVLAPAILYLFLKGDVAFGVGLAIWGVVAVGLIDNFLGPKLVGRGMQLHPLIILLSVLGGLGLFGPIGFLLGPLVMSLLFALLDIYSSLMKKE